MDAIANYQTTVSKFPPGKVPALERPDGFTLYECIPVSVYCRCISLPALLGVWRLSIELVAKQDPNTKLLGSSLEEEATALK